MAGSPPALTADQRREALQLLQAGTSARKVAERFGVDSNTIDRLRGSVSGGSSSIGPASDPFEEAQLAVFDRLKLELEVGDHNAQGLAQLAKAMNDTVKAIRQHRVMTKAVEREQTPRSQAAEMVRQRLEKLSKTQRMAVAVFEALTAPADDAKTGTKE